MNIAFVLEVLGRIGFSNILLTEDTKILELQELLAENQVNHQTFVEYISNPEAEGVKELCAEPEFVKLLLRSFTKHEFVIPDHIEPNQSYEMVRAKDRKQWAGDVTNGLYYYIDTFKDELAMPFHIMQRKDSSRAYILELPEQNGHLTIDKFYAKETPEGQYISYSAHIRFEKEHVQVRVYFDEKLNLVKTSAYLEDGSQKIVQVDPSSLHVSIDDYKPFFDQLSRLMTAYQQKIQLLDMAFTSKFMFIRTETEKQMCHQLIQEIAILKSPYKDTRLELIQKWQQPHRATLSPSMQALSVEEVLPIEADSKEEVTPKLVISSKKLKQDRKALAEQDIMAKIHVIQQKLLACPMSAEVLKQCFEHIIELEFSLIEHDNDIKEKQQMFNQHIDELKSACIDVMYQAISSKSLDFMEDIYHQCHYFIDSLIMGSFSELYQTMFQEKTSASDEKIKKLLSLFRYFFDKNDLCRAFFKAANQQVALGQSRVLSFFASLINHDEDPDYVLFLLEKGLISPTECVGVFKQHFISLQQYIFILMLTNESTGYEVLWKMFTENKSNFLTIHDKERFTSLVDDPRSLYILQPDQEKNKKSKKASQVSPFHEIDELKRELCHAQDFSYQLLDAIFCSESDNMHLQKMYQMLIDKDAVFAFWWLGALANHNEIRQTKLLSSVQDRRVYIFDKTFESYQDMISTLGIDLQAISPNHIVASFYPASNASVTVKHQLHLMTEVLDYVLQQQWMRSDDIAKIVNSGLMKEFSKVFKIGEKISISLGAEIYFVAMREISNEFYRNICFWQACNLDILARENQYTQVDARLALIGHLLRCVNDAAIIKNILLFVGRKLDDMPVETLVIREFRQNLLKSKPTIDCPK